MSKKQKPKGHIDFGKFEKQDGDATLVLAPPETTFSFKHICTGRHAPQQCSYPQLKSFNDKMRILSCLSWSSIDGSPRETSGYEIIGRESLSRSIPDRVPSNAQILVFRFGGGSGSKNSGRIAGFKQGHTFYILFVDSRLDLYDHS